LHLTGWKKAPDTKNALVKTEYKGNLIDAKLKYIREATLPSQKKRKVSGDTTEVERVLTVLYYESENKKARKSKGHHGDESG
jgi:hypothetical protein